MWGFIWIAAALAVLGCVHPQATNNNNINNNNNNNNENGGSDSDKSGSALSANETTILFFAFLLASVIVHTGPVATTFALPSGTFPPEVREATRVDLGE